VIEIEGEILGKPEDAEQAVAMLLKLSGKTHKVHTAVALITRDNQYSGISTSQVEFTELSAEDIKSYVETGEPLDKAGSYAIQGIAGQFVKSLKGSYSGVMGLPLFETAELIAACGINTIQNKK
jgi:septum formation protein